MLKKKSKKQAGKPMITLKLNGGISSTANLKSDQTELQTRINKIKSNIGIRFLEVLIFIFCTG